MTIKVFEAFAGIGSQAMALRNIGLDFEVVGISEVDRYGLIAYDAVHNNDEVIEVKTKEEMLEEFAKRNIAYNFSTGKCEIPKNEEEIRKLYEAHVRSKNYGDITKIDVNELPDFDLFTYSFPCKNISVAGKQAGLAEGSGTQSSLVWECRDIIKTKKPKYLLMENVKNLVGTKHKPFFDLWCKELEDMGYVNYWKVLNGKNFRVPQNRERVMMISIRKELVDKIDFTMPIGGDCGVRLKDILEDEVDEKYYINKECKLDFSLNAEVGNSLSQVGMLQSKGNESNRRVYDAMGIAPTLNSMNGGNRQPKIMQWNNVIIDDTQGFDKDEQGNKIPRVYEGVAPSLRAMRSGLKTLDCDYKIRKLIPLECWRLMGYTDEDFYKAKDAGLSNTKLYERAGRGIVVPMLEEIFRELFKEELNK